MKRWKRGLGSEWAISHSTDCRKMRCLDCEGEGGELLEPPLNEEDDDWEGEANSEEEDEEEDGREAEEREVEERDEEEREDGRGCGFSIFSPKTRTSERPNRGLVNCTGLSLLVTGGALSQMPNGVAP